MTTDLRDKRERCIACGVSVNDTCLFRTAPLGETPAKWKCKRCIDLQVDPIPDPDVVELSELIQNGGV